MKDSVRGGKSEAEARVDSLWAFTQRERKPALTSIVLGAFVGIGLHFLLSDRGVFTCLSSFLTTHGITQSRALPYFRDLAVLASICSVATLSFAAPLLRRAFRSWIVGCTSGIPTWLFLSTVILFMQAYGIGSKSVVAYAIASCTFFAISFNFYLRRPATLLNAITHTDLRVRPDERPSDEETAAFGDEPIRMWKEDILGRAAVVDIITNKALVAGAPVIAVSGPLGVGKTSVLNLLQDHIEDKAIVVRFVTWLPGAQDVLSSYLLADIATECQKQYVVPGLRRSTRRVAKALAEALPTLKGILEFLPASTQRDDIKALASALARLPKRVVVMLDELDRMEKDEVLTLLKMLRGLSDLPNCTFVCALDLDELMRTVRGERNQSARTYFEKFFPVTVPLPPLDNATLQRVGVQRLVESFALKSWFADEKTKQDFEKQLAECWGEMISPLCSTLRAIGLLTTNIDVSASLLRRQVEPLDLTLIEVLRQFRREIYSLVARNKLALTGGVNWARGGGSVSDERQKREETLFIANLDAALDPNDGEAIRALLARLFPKFHSIRQSLALHQRPKEHNDQSISDPEMFSAYFQFELPEGIYSSLELDEFLRDFRSASSEDGRARVFTKALRVLPKQSLRRDDFLRKLSVAASEMSKEEAQSLALTAVREAKEYTYDIFAGFGESGHVTRIVINAAQKMNHDERVSFLWQCIEVANDDTLAVRVLSTLTNPNTGVPLGVKNEELRPAFMERMRRQYGPEADAQMDLTTSDPEAFQQWGWTPPNANKDTEDRRIQQDFWLRRIGQSRKKLAEVFDTFIMPRTFAYPNDPAPMVDNTLTVAILERLLNELPNDEELNDRETKAFDRMRRLVTGEFRNGIPMSEIG